MYLSCLEKKDSIINGGFMEDKIIKFENSEKVTKSELAVKMIEMHTSINQVKIEACDERRRMKKDFDRKINEVKLLALGNKRDVKQLYRRVDDNVEQIEKLQSYIQWTIKTILGILLTVMLTIILNAFINIL